MQKKEQLRKIIIKLLETNLELMKFYKSITKDEKSISICEKSLRQTKKALKVVLDIEHEEILASLYNTLISGKENIFVVCASLLVSKNIQKWDKTENGFKEFLEMEKEARAKQQAEIEEQRKNAELIKKAREEGKKVEMVYENGKLKPVFSA